MKKAGKRPADKVAERAAEKAKEMSKARERKAAKKPTRKAAQKSRKEPAEEIGKSSTKQVGKRPAARSAAAEKEAPSSYAARPQESGMAVVAHYRRLLAGAPLGGGTSEGTGLESIGAPQPAEVSLEAIDDHVEFTRTELHRIVKGFLGDEPELHDLADEIARVGKPALESVRDDDENRLGDLEIRGGLEVIVRTDGSRPSFMVRNGEPDLRSSPVGTWGAILSDSGALLNVAIDCVGRIDDPSGSQGFLGTGILVERNHIVTNRHVLQAISTEKAGGRFDIKPNIAIDFGHEFRARDTLRRRGIRGVVFAGAKRIDPNLIDHSKLDLVLLELDGTADPPPRVLALDLSPDWGQQQTNIFIIGYPGNPGFADPPSLLEKLFKSTFGCKRVAPGLVTTAASRFANSPRQWTLGHDATTLGGNSGSAVVVVGRERLTAGLHYGGTRLDPRENWCHVIGRAVDETDGRSKKTLRQLLQDRGVELVDPF